MILMSCIRAHQIKALESQYPGALPNPVYALPVARHPGISGQAQDHFPMTRHTFDPPPLYFTGHHQYGHVHVLTASSVTVTTSADAGG